MATRSSSATPPTTAILPALQPQYPAYSHPLGPPPRLDDYVAAAKIGPPDNLGWYPVPPVDNTNPPAILSFHNAVPRESAGSGPLPVVLPPVSAASRVLGQSPLSAYGNHHHHQQQHPHSNHSSSGKPRSLSIQSLISPELSPPTTASYSSDTLPQTRKRKGSDDVGATRRGSIASAAVTMDDPEVRVVVEALGGLKGDFTATSPTNVNRQHGHGSSPGEQSENEPLINLITSSAQRAHPIISSVITTGISAYGASKSYSPSFRYAAESVETRVGVPVGNVVSAVGRQTGLDSALRRGLGGNRRANSDGEQQADTKKRKTNNRDGDLEGSGEHTLKALAAEQQRQFARINGVGNTNGTSRDEDKQVAAQNQTWPTRVVQSTYGFGAALNEESLKNLKYCLHWLRYLNAHLGKLVGALKTVVEELENYQQSQPDEEASQTGGGIARILPSSYGSSRAALAAKVERLKGDVISTMKKVVEIVSNYTGSALPENARDLIKRHIFALPHRFQAANATELGQKDRDSPMSSASRALVLAKEGLDMMQQVSAVVEGTIDRAEEWCERLGKKKPNEYDHDRSHHAADKKAESNGKSVEWNGNGQAKDTDRDGDVFMGGGDKKV